MSDGHLGELVSALADGELTGTALSVATAHLEGCEPCRRELAAMRAIRDQVRSLPRAEPPDGFLAAAIAGAARAVEATVGQLRRRALEVAAGVAAALVLALAAPGATDGGDLVPFSAVAFSLAGLTTTAESAPSPTDESVPSPFVDRETLAGYTRVGVHRSGDAVAQVYSDGVSQMMLTQHEGHLDTEGLDAAEPDPTHPSQWRVATAGSSTAQMVWERGGVIFVLSAPAAMTGLESAPDEIGAPAHRSLLDDLRRRCHAMVDLLGLD